MYTSVGPLVLEVWLESSWSLTQVRTIMKSIFREYSVIIKSPGGEARLPKFKYLLHFLQFDHVVHVI